MPMHERIDINAMTGEEVKYCICACLDEYKQECNVTLMNFQKIARSEGKASGDDDDDNYDGDDGVTSENHFRSL